MLLLMLTLMGLKMKYLIKEESKAQENKIVKLLRHDLSYFQGKNLFADDGFQNMFVYLLMLTLKLKKAKALIMFLV